ncbi:hypothetical protein G6F62_003993 [Rhizopus arrhizus]|nr:hypothetical protein G6F62_003993 [Rhizopus arrhizus]
MVNVDYYYQRESMYDRLQTRVRQVFGFPDHFKFKFGYKDKENDFVVLGSDRQMSAVLPYGYDRFSTLPEDYLMCFTIVPDDKNERTDQVSVDDLKTVTNLVSKFETNLSRLYANMKKNVKAIDELIEKNTSRIEAVATANTTRMNLITEHNIKKMNEIVESNRCMLDAALKINMDCMNDAMEGNLTRINDYLDGNVHKMNKCLTAQSHFVCSTINQHTESIHVCLNNNTQHIVSNVEKEMTALKEHNSKATEQHVEMVIKSAAHLYHSTLSNTKQVSNDNVDIICDGCCSPIKGQSWICDTCDNFDLCNTCRFQLNHDPDHNLIYIKEKFKESHNACKHCDSELVGTRYTCTSCPGKHPNDHRLVAQTEDGKKECVDETDDAVCSASVVQHSDVLCDHCGMNIKGVQYKCKYCSSYSLCEICKESSWAIHFKNHLFLKIRDPSHSKTKQPNLQKSQALSDPFDKDNLPLNNSFQAPVRAKNAKLSSDPSTLGIQERLQAEYDMRARRVMDLENELQFNSNQCLPIIHTSSQGFENDQPSFTITQQISQTKSVLSAQFIADINIPDGTCVLPKKNFIKTWKVRNNGNIHWPTDSRLLFNGGNIFKPYPMSFPEGFLLPGLAPNQEGCISAELQAPDSPGDYTSRFCFITPEGDRFGDELYCIIKVAEDEFKDDNSMIYPTLSTQPCDNQSISTIDQSTTDYQDSHSSHSIPFDLHSGSDDFVPIEHDDSDSKEDKNSFLEEMSRSDRSQNTVKVMSDDTQEESSEYHSEFLLLHKMIRTEEMHIK